MHIQIDVTSIEEGMVACNLYTGDRCVKIYMTEYEYKELVCDGFFIRNGKEKDGAGVLNTTKVFNPES